MLKAKINYVLSICASSTYLRKVSTKYLST